MQNLGTMYFSIGRSGAIIVPAQLLQVLDIGLSGAAKPKKGSKIMSNTLSDPFGARASLDVGDKQFLIYSLAKLGQQTGADLSRLPFSIRVVLEALLRNVGDGFTSTEDVMALANWTPDSVGSREVAFTPARVLLQDFTGVPAVVDLAAMRGAMQLLGGDPARINPLAPADLVID